jgi:hypothetical protein
MAFSILSRRLLENNDIRRIAEKVDRYDPIINYYQQQALGIKVNTVSTMLTLRDYDSTANRGYVFRLSGSSSKIDYDVDTIYKYNYVLPIIRYEEIKGDSKIVSEDDDTITIKYGRHITSNVQDDDTKRKIEVANMMGNLVESGRKITFLLDKDGKKTQLRVFRNTETGEEYVFFSKREDGMIDDSVHTDAMYIGVVSELTWTVDKKTGLAICSNPLFFSEVSLSEYESTALKSFLESDEFVEELGVKKVMKEEKKPVNSPFGDKRVKLSLEQKIRRILMGEKRIPYLVGHPGIGKTQIAKSINKNCLSFNIATFTPDTFTGKTMVVPGDKTITKDGDKTIEHSERGRTATSEPEWHVQLMEMSNRCRQNNERCVLLLDEFDKLTPNMQVFINGIVDDPRTIAGWVIPDNVDIILAGNTEEYSDAAFNISGEVASRLTRVEVTADAIDWLKWASKHDIDPIVRAYLHNFPSKILQDVKDEDGDYDYARSLTPRSWDQKISEELKAARRVVKPPYLEPYMDEPTRKDFEAFIDLYISLHIEEILTGIFPSDIYDLTHDKIQIIINCLIATARTEEEIYNSLLFIDYFNLHEYRALFEKRWVEINDTDDDILKFKLAKSRLDERRSGYGK